MRTVQLQHMTLGVDFTAGQITSLILRGRERVHAPTPLFRLRLRDRGGATVHLCAYDAKVCRELTDGAVYTGFHAEGVNLPDTLAVTVRLTVEGDFAAWRGEITVGSPDFFAEWLDLPLINLPALRENNPNRDGGQVLLPYNEGVLISDNRVREQTDFRHYDPEYPSMGCYSLFPNMVSSQMLAYLWEDAGLYVGAHDPARGVKGVDFYPEGDGITLQIRLFCGVDFGESFTMDYPIIWAVTDGRWESAAEVYRGWFEAHLPPRVAKIRDNTALPDWYRDAPLVVSYPVRGVHDMDEMTPNALFPYVNALPLLERIRNAAESRLLVLLMHWEGTAPWAPPFVWPPFGGVEGFNAFRDALHERGDLLGVYCSGFGYTLQSNLIADYNGQETYEREGLSHGMCAAPNGEVGISRICTGQRVGYDVCPASPVGRKLLDEAYAPLFDSGADYAQILDQNHGGGQYFCYSRDHGHPPAPGVWMTRHMQDMLSGWNRRAPSMLFGCESAAAEPFMGNLLFSDNRFELNYMIGKPVPLYAYLYHEYIRNFMGNQVCGDVRSDTDTLPYRIAYSFAAGDCMTVVLTPDGQLMQYWGTRDFEHAPDMTTVMTLIANLTRCYREEAAAYLYAGRMIPARPVDCAQRSFHCGWVDHHFALPTLLTSAWEAEDGTRAQILVNPDTEEAVCTVAGESIRVPALSAVLIHL